MIARFLLPLAALALLSACNEESAASEPRPTAPQEAISSQRMAENMSPSDVGELLMLERNAVLLDVRTAEEFSQGHIEHATNIDFKADDFAEKVAELPRDRDYILYCRSGRRSAAAQETMEKLGFEDVANMEGGIVAWEERGLPTVQ